MKNKTEHQPKILPKLAVVLAIAGMFGGVGAYRQILCSQKNAVSQQDTTVVVPSVKKPVRSVAYHNDTIDQNQLELLIYSNNKITRYYLEGNQAFMMQLPYFAHEWWHAHNDKLKYRTAYNLMPEEYFKLCLHDEISAKLAAILTARYEYLSAPDKKAVIKQYKKTYMKFYFEAIEKSKIHPERMDSVNRDKEWRFLANGVRDMWMKIYYHIYATRTAGMLGRFIDRKGLVEDSGDNYEYIRHQMFTIGGIDFANYMDHDIVTTDEKVMVAENIRKVSELRHGGREIVDAVYSQYPFLKEVGCNDRINILQHVLIAARMKQILKQIDAEDLRANTALLNTCFQRISETFRQDRDYKNLLNNMMQMFPLTPISKTDPAKIDQFLQRIYTIEGVDISKFIDHFDVKNVPIREDNYFGHIEQNAQRLPCLLSVTSEQMAMKDLRHRRELRHKDKISASSTKPADILRISEDFYVALPNFEEPILLNSSDKDNEEIFKAVQYFASIPSVLKGCHTKAKRQYVDEHPDTVAKLRLGREYLPQ